jgi:precorrin-4/cobalt-precorrin-4 C11-methyltransferase
MKVRFVGSGPGDPELLTVKARRLLESAAVCVYAGSLVSPGITALLPETCRRYDSASMDLGEICRVYGEAAENGLDVVRLHSGDPSIYGAIGEQMTELDRMGIDYEVIPGVSSFQAAAAALRTELTAPEISQTIVLTRTSGRTPMPEGQELSRLAQTGATLCIFLSTHKIQEVTSELARFYGDDCPAAAVYHVTWPDQTIFRGTLADLADKVTAYGVKKTAMIVVGRALERSLPVSKLYDRAFTHEYRVGEDG